MEIRKDSKLITIITGDLIKHREGPHTALKNFVDILKDKYKIKIVGFVNKKTVNYKKNWKFNNTKIVGLRNNLRGHYYFNSKCSSCL